MTTPAQADPEEEFDLTGMHAIGVLVGNLRILDDNKNERPALCFRFANKQGQFSPPVVLDLADEQQYDDLLDSFADNVATVQEGLSAS